MNHKRENKGKRHLLLHDMIKQFDNQIFFLHTCTYMYAFVFIHIHDCMTVCVCNRLVIKPVHTCSLCRWELVVQFPARGSTQVLCLFPGVLRLWHFLYSVSPHSMSSLHIYTFVVSRAFMAGAASQAGDADSSRAPGLTSGLQGSVNVHRGALLLVPQWRCISSFVFLQFCQTCFLCRVELVVRFPPKGSTQVLLCLFPGVLWLWHFLYSVGPHSVSSLHLYTFVVLRAFMAGAAYQAGDADSSRALGLTSGLQGSVNAHRGALLLVPQWRCISSFVFSHTVIIISESYWTDD